MKLSRKVKLPNKPVLRFAAFGCAHCPLLDKRSFDLALAAIEEYKPDVIVNLGDTHEADSASRWPSEYSWTLADEFRAADKMRRAVREACPGAVLVELPGNHDDNLLELNRIDKKLRDLCDWREPHYCKGELLNRELLEHWSVPCEYVYDRRRGVFRIGQVTFGHGYEANGSSDENQSITLGVPVGLWIGAHTHRPLPVQQAHKNATLPLPYWYCNVGTLSQFDRPYMKRKRQMTWGAAVVLGEADQRWGPHKSLRATPKWSAETKVLRMFDD